MTIKDILILPPLAFARVGSASVPQPSYKLCENTDDPLGFRRIVASKPTIVKEDGKLIPDTTDYTDGNAIFRDGNRIRPVAPFFELFAIREEDGKQMRLTVKMLKKAKLDLSVIQWRVHVENRKVFRRTGDTKDIVKAKTELFSDHRRHDLRGECENFGGKDHYVHFGCVQFVKPGADGAIRLRFTPAEGKAYGLSEEPKYQKGTWTTFDQTKPGHSKEGSSGKTWPRETLPPSLFAIEPPAPPWLNGNRAKSRGYFDDICDGFISVSVKLPNGIKSAKARICVGPPSFIPDSLFIRTLADDLDQAVNGPTADDISPAEAHKLALDIVRRGYEAVRFMNVAVMNGNPVNGRAPEQFDTMPAEESFGTERPVRPVMSPASVDTAAIMALHRQVYAALSSGAAPWFPRLLRKPEEMGDLTDRGRRKMPALMSGADSFYLALTRRQIATVEKAAEGDTGIQARSDAKGAKEQGISPRNLTAMLKYEVRGNPVNSRPEMAIANCCPGLEVDFRAVWRHLFEGIELCEHDNYVVEDTRKKNPDGTSVRQNLKGHRLLSVGYREGDKLRRHPVIVELKGPSPSNPYGDVPVLSGNNPHGVWTMEWSNSLAHVVNAQRMHKAAQQLANAPADFVAVCEFTKEPAETPQRPGKLSCEVDLRVREFFEGQTAVISKELAGPGELTQGLCSPWQNDLRECSCFYWASSRPDFVNMTVGNDGLSHGDNWLSKERVGEYVPDDYVDERLMGYDDLFDNWEKELQFQIGGKDSAPPKPRKP